MSTTIFAALAATGWTVAVLSTSGRTLFIASLLTALLVGDVVWGERRERHRRRADARQFIGSLRCAPETHVRVVERELVGWP